MKKIMIITVSILGFSILSAFKPSGNIKKSSIEINTGSDFCDGWSDGYCEGWKDVKGQYAICPITPICPIAEIGQDSYKGGYNRGFKAGMRAANNN